MVDIKIPEGFGALPSENQFSQAPSDISSVVTYSNVGAIVYIFCMGKIAMWQSLLYVLLQTDYKYLLVDAAIPVLVFTVHPFFIRHIDFIFRRFSWYSNVNSADLVLTLAILASILLNRRLRHFVSSFYGPIRYFTPEPESNPILYFKLDSEKFAYEMTFVIIAYAILTSLFASLPGWQPPNTGILSILKRHSDGYLVFWGTLFTAAMISLFYVLFSVMNRYYKDRE